MKVRCCSRYNPALAVVLFNEPFSIATLMKILKSKKKTRSDYEKVLGLFHTKADKFENANFGKKRNKVFRPQMKTDKMFCVHISALNRRNNRLISLWAYSQYSISLSPRILISVIDWSIVFFLYYNSIKKRNLRLEPGKVIERKKTSAIRHYMKMIVVIRECIKSILKSLVILAIWLALSDAIFFSADGIRQ